MLILIPEWLLYSTKWMTMVVRWSATVWNGLWSWKESNNSAISIDQYFSRGSFLRGIITLCRFASSILMLVNVNFELISVVVKIKSRRTHCVNHPRRIQLSPSWIGNQALDMQQPLNMQLIQKIAFGRYKVLTNFWLKYCFDKYFDTFHSDNWTKFALLTIVKNQ